MAKLFIFAIGGTGSRVVKALTMLLASGVKLDNISTVVPIIVDPHKSNKDLLRTEGLLKNYAKIRSSLHTAPVSGEFFGTDIKTLKEIVPASTPIGNSYTFQLSGVNNSKFSDYIDYVGLDKSVTGAEPYTANKDLVDLLFSEENLNTSMDIGFVGNPNMGSVVLNQFEESDEYEQFAANFQKGDRIFIISSIFGGTGAAGFPVILKNIRNAHLGKVATPEWLKNAPIGAITVLPYFGISPNDENLVDQATFYSKTKAALQYYNRGINRLVNRFYYLGDTVVKNFEYDPGEKGQQNDAHFIELAAALSVVDFCRIDNGDLKVTDGIPEGTTFKEFSIKDAAESFGFNNLHHQTNNVIVLPMAKFHLFWLYVTKEISGFLDQAWLEWPPKLDKSFFNAVLFTDHLKPFLNEYNKWLEEMKSNKRRFQPFRLEGELDQVFEGFSPEEKWYSFSKTSFKQLNNFAAPHAKKVGYPTAADKLVKAFGFAADEFLKERFPTMYSSFNN